MRNEKYWYFFSSIWNSALTCNPSNSLEHMEDGKWQYLYMYAREDSNFRSWSAETTFGNERKTFESSEMSFHEGVLVKCKPSSSVLLGIEFLLEIKKSTEEKARKRFVRPGSVGQRGRNGEETINGGKSSKEKSDSTKQSWRNNTRKRCGRISLKLNERRFHSLAIQPIVYENIDLGIRSYCFRTYDTFA